MNKLDAKCSAGDFKGAARLSHFVVLRLGDNVENLVDLGGLELTGTAERFRIQEKRGCNSVTRKEKMKGK